MIKLQLQEQTSQIILASTIGVLIAFGAITYAQRYKSPPVLMSFTSTEAFPTNDTHPKISKNNINTVQADHSYSAYNANLLPTVKTKSR